MDSNRQSEIRKEIAEIQRDTTLSPQEKASRMQLALSGRYRRNVQAQEEEEKKNLDLSQTYFQEGIFGCKHYKRNCKVKAPCCQQFYTCRRCHDESVTGHKINRYQIQEMMCFFCSTIQPVAQNCAHCHKVMAKYFCPVCKFWDDDEKKVIWHCEQCGLCRVSTNHAQEHCNLCNCCMPIGHTEHSDLLHNNCPICSEDLFTSTQSAFMPEPCKHSIHNHCFKDYLRRGNYTCPICSKTYGNLDMTDAWTHRDQIIAANPMPEEYKDWKVEFLCNDCNVKETALWHFIGQKCTKCGGYNTVISETYRPEIPLPQPMNIETGGDQDNQPQPPVAPNPDPPAGSSSGEDH